MFSPGSRPFISACICLYNDVLPPRGVSMEEAIQTVKNRQKLLKLAVGTPEYDKLNKLYCMDHPPTDFKEELR